MCRNRLSSEPRTAKQLQLQLPRRVWRDTMRDSDHVNIKHDNHRHDYKHQHQHEGNHYHHIKQHDKDKYIDQHIDDDDHCDDD